MTTTSERGIPAGRCFWGMQYLLRRFPGVISTRVGYTGGDVSNAIYRNHEIHAETVESLFDARKLTGSFWSFYFRFMTRSRRIGTATTSDPTIVLTSSTRVTNRDGLQKAPSWMSIPQASGGIKW